MASIKNEEIMFRDYAVRQDLARIGVSVGHNLSLQELQELGSIFQGRLDQALNSGQFGRIKSEVAFFKERMAWLRDQTDPAVERDRMVLS